jgi:NAD(P)-dependent dehydrogenase (short-subunit alcohol dehydrogenase family)
MDNDLKRTRQPACVVAGAGPRLGMAIAERFAAEGFAAYPLSRTPERLIPRIAELRARSLTVWPISCDLADADAIDTALRHVRERHGFCDVLVYNAFGAGDDLRVNLGGALALVEKTLDGMQSAGAGAMLFTGCSAATSTLSLGIGQACLRVLVDYLVPKLEQSGIRAGIVTVSPSIVDDALYVQRAAQAYWEMFITSERAYIYDVRVEC